MAYTYRTLEKGFCEKIDEDGNCIALLIHSRWKGERVQKWLYATSFHSIGQMWGEAREIMRQILKNQNKPDTPAKIRYASIDGGITRKVEHGLAYWGATWINGEGKLENVYFSVRKYGERRAKRYARQARDQAVRHYYGFDPKDYRK